MCFRMVYGLTLAAVCMAACVWASAVCVTLSYTPPSGSNTCDGFVTQDRMILVTVKAPVLTRTNQTVYVDVTANQTQPVRVKTTVCCPAYRRVNNSCVPDSPYDHPPEEQAHGQGQGLDSPMHYHSPGDKRVSCILLICVVVEIVAICVVVLAFIIRRRCQLLGYQSRVVDIRWHSDRKREIPDSPSPLQFGFYKV